MKNVLTIGMACYDDSKGVINTIQQIRLANYQLMDRIRWVIVDNHPNSTHSTEIINFFGWLGTEHQYIPLASPVGTSAPRQMVFDVAQTDWVMCVDSHIFLAPGALEALLNYIDAHENSDDLLSGPILKDDLTVMATHFQDIWNADMWGVWGLDQRGIDPTNKPFEIPAMGLGLFCCRKEMWKKVGGFNSKFRGFGGEEFYIHKKFYRAGAKCLCLPAVKWWHDFHKGNGIPYKHAASTWNNARNYVIGHDELNLPFDNIMRMFVPHRVPMHEWLYLIQTPNNPPELPPGITHQMTVDNAGNPNFERPVPVVQPTTGPLQPVTGAVVEPITPSRFRLTLRRGNTVEELPVQTPSPAIQSPTVTPTPPVMPSLAAQMWNATKALAAFVSDGLTTVSQEEYEHRLGVCEVCPNRANTRCSLCGCHLELKARGRAFNCPANKWNYEKNLGLVSSTKITGE